MFSPINSRVLGLVLFGLYLVGLAPAFAAPPMLTGQKGAEMVAATPISIPRPIRLEAVHTPTPTTAVQMIPGQSVQKIAQTGRISACDLSGIRGRELSLSLRYELDRAIRGPVYFGAFLYDADNRAVNVGYKPAMASQLPSGSGSLVLVLPETSFRAAEIETFLMHAGKVIVKQRFSMPLAWDGLSGRLTNGTALNTPPVEATGIKGKPQFCREYADEATALYRMATVNKVPNIPPPVWSNDHSAHYTWCLSAPYELAIQGSEGRKAHLLQHLPMSTPGLSKLLQTAINPGRGP